MVGYAAPRKYRVIVQGVFEFPTEIVQEEEYCYPNRSSSDHGEILVEINGVWEYANYNIYDRLDLADIVGAYAEGRKLKPRVFNEGYRKP